MSYPMQAALAALGFQADDEVLFEPFSVHAAGWSGFDAVTSLKEYYLALQDYIREVALPFVEKGVIFPSLDGVMISPFAEIGEVVHEAFEHLAYAKNEKTLEAFEDVDRETRAYARALVEKYEK